MPRAFWFFITLSIWQNVNRPANAGFNRPYWISSNRWMACLSDPLSLVSAIFMPEQKGCDGDKKRSWRAGSLAESERSLSNREVLHQAAGSTIASIPPPHSALGESNSRLARHFALWREIGLARGTRAGETRLLEVMLSGGFSRVRRATTPLYLEAPPG